MTTKVAVQQRQRLYREGLGLLLQAQDDMVIVGTAGSSVDFIDLCIARRPDVAVLEADVVEWDTARLVRDLKHIVPALRVVGLTAGEPSPADAARAHRNGFRDVLPRSTGIDEILLAVRGTSPLPRHRPRKGSAAGPCPGDADPVLTPRELTILGLVGAGFTSREISAELTISHKTVENHKQRIFGKLQVQNQAHAVSVAMRRGLMHPERVINLALAD